MSYEDLNPQDVLGAITEKIALLASSKKPYDIAVLRILHGIADLLAEDPKRYAKFGPAAESPKVKALLQAVLEGKWDSADEMLAHAIEYLGGVDDEIVDAKKALRLVRDLQRLRNTLA